MKTQLFIAAIVVFAACDDATDDPQPLASASASPAATAPAITKSDAPPADELPRAARRALAAYTDGDMAYLQQLADDGIVKEHQLVRWKQTPNRIGARLEPRLSDSDPPCTTYRYRTAPRGTDAWIHELHLSVCGSKLASMYVFGW